MARAMSLGLAVVVFCLRPSSSQELPRVTEQAPVPRASGCPVKKLPGEAQVPKELQAYAEEEPAEPGNTYVYRMAEKPANVHYNMCAKLGGVDGRFNDPCAWALGEAQLTVAQFTGLCKGATRQVHWHDGADEWGYVNKGQLRTFIASPTGLPWPNSVNEISQHGVWYFPRGWLHSLLCITPEEEGGCVLTLVFASPVSVPIDDHDLDTTLAQAPDEVAAAALGVKVEIYRPMRKSFAGAAGPRVNASVSSSPLVVFSGVCDPKCPEIQQTMALPAAVDAAMVEKLVEMPGGVKLFQIFPDRFQFAVTMGQERTEVPAGSLRPLVWLANSDALLVVTSGEITLGLQGGEAGSANPQDAHKAYTEIHLLPGDVSYLPVGRAYWFKEATNHSPASTITVFNVGNWKPVELSMSTELLPPWAVGSSLRLPVHV